MSGAEAEMGPVRFIRRVRLATAAVMANWNSVLGWPE